MNCLFCSIVKKEIKSSIVFENERILAFRDINPQAPAHIVIIPKKHIPGVNDLSYADNALIGEMCNVARELAAKDKVDVSGYRLVVNCGPDAGQSVAHIHLHLLGGRAFAWPPG